MTIHHAPGLSRRGFLTLSAAAGATATILRPVSAAAAADSAASGPVAAAPVAPTEGALAPRRFIAAPARAQILPEGRYPATPVWSYEGVIPGPTLRYRQGERLAVRLENRLDQPTTLHWHGLRVPHAMDGVPGLTQPPVQPGAAFDYAFTLPDAGTYWYHAHLNGAEQVGRGLYGALIVDEPTPPRADRDLLWVLDDWRLGGDGSLMGGFGSGHDRSHGGRLGNVITINGRVPDTMALRPNERIRLRLVNAANARIFALDFAGLGVWIIARDGQPAKPERPDGPILLGPGMRVDLMVDANGAPGSEVAVVDRYSSRNPYRLIALVHGAEPLRAKAPDWPVELSPNPLPEPDLGRARRHEIIFNGGMGGTRIMAEMGGSMGPNGARLADMGAMQRAGVMWFLNGRGMAGDLGQPLLTLAGGDSHVITLTNATGWDHPMHLHGHAFRVLSRNGRPLPGRPWADTVLMAPRERVEIALVADNPGDWLFHCHILEHREGGMAGIIRVT